MITIEYVRDEPKEIEIHGVGRMKRGLKVICSESIAREFSKDKRFKIIGLYQPKQGGKK